MACQVTIVEVVGRNPDASGRPTLIVVLGTATDCSGVRVDVGNQTYTTSVRSDGSWEGQFPTGPTFAPECDETVKVYAVCLDDLSCSSPVQERRVRCIAGEACPDQIRLEIRDSSGATVALGPNQPCLPPGTYTIVVVDPPASPTTQYAWSDSGSPGPIPSAPNYQFSIAAGESRFIGVRVVPEQCPPLRDRRLITGCEQPTDGCPTVSIIVTDASGNPVDAGPSAACKQSGFYRADVSISPPFPGNIQYQWTVNGASLVGYTLSWYGQSLGAGQILEINVRVTPQGCPPTDLHATIVTCYPPPTDCPQTITLRLTDSSGNEVDLSHCLPSGVYTVEVVQPPSDPTFQYHWSVNGFPAASTGRTHSESLTPGQIKTVAVSIERAGCPPLQGHRTLEACRRDQPPKVPKRGGGGFDLCSLILAAWLAGFVGFGWALYWNWGPVAIAGFAVAYVAGLVLWLWKCCKCRIKVAEPRSFIRRLLDRTILCCALLQWHWIALAILIAGMGNYAWVFQLVTTLTAPAQNPLPGFNPTVMGVYTGLILAVLTALFAIPHCPIPNPFRKRTYPGSRC